MDLTGKQILIAGAASDIGRLIVHQINRLGAKLVIIDTEAELQEISSSISGNNTFFYGFDIYQNEQIEPNIKQIVTDHGQFDGFVYCAGLGGVRPLSFTKLENLFSMMNANCFSFVEMVRVLSKKKNFSSGGSIVAVSSISSIKGLKSKLAYSASKAALDAAVRSLAAELSERKIRVNTILKGGVSSDNNLAHIKNIVGLNDNETARKQIIGETEPYEIANMVSFLLSDAVTTMTGASIIIDGGYTL